MPSHSNQRKRKPPTVHFKTLGIRIDCYYRLKRLSDRWSMSLADTLETLVDAQGVDVVEKKDDSGE